MKEAHHPADPILIVDDEPGGLMVIDALLRQHGMLNMLSCQDSREVLNLVAEHTPSLVLLDLDMPYVSGEIVLEKLKSAYPDLPVIVVTGTETVETAVRCMKQGAFDYVTKPVDATRLATACLQAVAVGAEVAGSHRSHDSALSRAVKNPSAFTGIATNCHKMLSIFRHLESIARSSEPVLITGETGVGKDLIAQALHNLSERQGSLVAFNVAGIDHRMLLDMLFGPDARAANGLVEAGGLLKRAVGGTLFLDQVGDLSPQSQALLLRLVEDRAISTEPDDPAAGDVRIVSVTQKDLWDLVKEDQFRSDLNFRLRTHHLHIPPLRERREDIPLLVRYFVDQATVEMGRPLLPVDDELWPMLRGYPFPGNVRELRAMIYTAVSSSERTLSLKAVERHIECAAGTVETPAGESGATVVQFPSELPSLKQATELLVAEALRRADGNQSRAGRMIGISQQAVSKRMRASLADTPQSDVAT